MRALLEERSGTTSIEFALVSLPFTAVLVAVFGFGYIGFLNNDLSHVANDVQRLVLVHHVTDEQTIRELIGKRFYGDEEDLEISIYPSEIGAQPYLNVEMSLVISFPGPVEVLRNGIQLQHKRSIPL